MTNDELYYKLKNADKFSYRVKKILQQFELGKLSFEDAHKAICAEYSLSDKQSMKTIIQKEK